MGLLLSRLPLGWHCPSSLCWPPLACTCHVICLLQKGLAFVCTISEHKSVSQPGLLWALVLLEKENTLRKACASMSQLQGTVLFMFLPHEVKWAVLGICMEELSSNRPFTLLIIHFHWHIVLVIIGYMNVLCNDQIRAIRVLTSLIISFCWTPSNFPVISHKTCNKLFKFRTPGYAIFK